MKNNLILLTLVLATACGNPHISSSRDGLERTTPPIEADPSCVNNVAVNSIQYYVDDAASFTNVARCNPDVDDDINDHTEGDTDTVDNDDNHPENPTVIHHQTEDNTDPQDPDKAITLMEIFGLKKYVMRIENPITLNGVKGMDRGINSLNASNFSRDALVWSFVHPISSWSVNLVGVKNASLKIFDCNETLIEEKTLSEDRSFVGFISYRPEICHVSLTAQGNSEAVAIDRFTYSR